MSTTATLALGLDFGTESVRALLVDIASGGECATASQAYAHGVIDTKLPDSNITLPQEWALQDALDYKSAMRSAIEKALAIAGVKADSIIGVGIDFTACTILPTISDGTPLSSIAAFRDNPHAYTKLWKHHAAQPEATRITELALSRNETWLRRYGGKVSSEWMHSKVLQVLNEAPEIYNAADQFIEAGDWIVWQLVGKAQRNACAAGYKALWNRTTGYPDDAFLVALDPRLHNLLQKLRGPILAPGTLAGKVTQDAAEWSGLAVGTPVAIATIDAHAAVPGAGVSDAGNLVMILGTSTCHMVLSQNEAIIDGIAGVVEDGILPGFFGYEAGQAGVGDSFEWFVRQAVPRYYEEEAARQNLNIFAYLEKQAATLKPGESGLLALDWWNGNRSILCDAELSGAIFGLTLNTRPHEIYRAMIEATAFGTRIILDQFESGGVPINTLHACGGLAANNALLLQIYADVTNRPIHIASSTQTSALGAAILGSLAAGSAAGGFDSIGEAARALTKPPKRIVQPIPEHHKTYQFLFAEYHKLHDLLGSGQLPTLKRLRNIRDAGV
jgi:L-ribulokinase